MLKNNRFVLSRSGFVLSGFSRSHVLREEGGEGVADVVETLREDAVLVEVEAVGFLGTGEVFGWDAELTGFVVDGLGAVGAAGQADAHREALPIGDYGIQFGLEREDGNIGILEDIEIADVAPEVADGEDAAGRDG